MQDLNELTQILYELAMDVGNGLDLQPMLRRSLRTILRKLSGFGAVVIARRDESEGPALEPVITLPMTLPRNPEAVAVIERVCAGDESDLPPTDWRNPKCVPCGQMWIYRLDLPGYGMLLLFKALPLDPVVARSLKNVCGKLADACLACETSEELTNSRERLQVTFDAIGDAVIVTDRLGRVTRMNPVAEMLTGWTMGDARLRPLREVFNIINGETRKPVENPVETVIALERTTDLANGTVLISKHGVERQIADSGAPIRDSKGAVTGVVLVFRDVTEEYALQEQLRHSQKMDAVGKLAGGIAHDFNNMLGGIMGAAEVLEVYLIDDPKAGEFHKMIMDTAQRAAELTQKLLSFARKRPASNKVVDLHALINDTIALLKSTIDKRVTIKTHFFQGDLRVEGDPSQLQNALLNVGINAWHAMPEGGMLVLSTAIVELDEEHCKHSQFALEPGSYLDIEIRDTGCGIPTKNLSHVFEPFFSTKGQGRGTGLGLAALFATVKQHRGSVSVHSEMGKGTCFHILLPQAYGELTHAPLPESDVPTGTGTILVVDDEPVMLSTAQVTLESLGYTVLTATDGKEALDLFDERHDQIDMVILDMVMPNMNGRDCFKAMRELEPDAKIILASGFSQEDFLEEMNSEGLCDYIRKPFSKRMLGTVVHRTMTTDGS